MHMLKGRSVGCVPVLVTKKAEFDRVGTSEVNHSFGVAIFAGQYEIPRPVRLDLYGRHSRKSLHEKHNTFAGIRVVQNRLNTRS
ncbi:hypothetical protein VNO77_03971 [Canavalia gladiata]|uniref:Uncharacterized protein n=1 Tax=Canavalia gladiata TaxID=3824 RepID=A0AAN9N0U8_CANGL